MNMARLLLAVFIFWPILAEAQTNLNVNTVHMSSSSLAFSWNNISSPWDIGLSSNNFSSQIFQGTLASNSTSYTSLIPNTTYWFRAKVSAEPAGSFAINTVSTLTYAVIPQGLSFSYKAAESYDSAELRTAFTLENPPYTKYQIEYSSDAAINNILVVGVPPLTLPSLLANTTYTIRIKSVDSAERSLGFSTSITTSTLSAPLSGVYFSVFETSSTANWTPLNSPQRELSCEGYKIIVSTNADFRDSVYTWSSSDNNNSSNDITPLQRNTTHYVKLGSLNWNSEANFSLRAFTTLSAGLSGFSLLSISSGSASLSWTALPASPPSSSAEGYVLEASTSSNFTSKYSSYTYSLNAVNLSFSSLDPNTTYYFRAASINQAGNKNYTAYIETVTYSMTYGENDIGVIATTKSVTLTFSNLPASPESLSGRGYRMELSTLPFTTGIILSSESYVLETNSLTIDNLKGNTSYYIRLGVYNRNLTLNYSPILNTLTLTPPAVSSAHISTKTFNSVTVTYMPGNTDGYVLEASLSEFFNSIAASSVTTLSSLSTLTVSGLSLNTSYYFRLGSLFQGATVYNYQPGAAYTLTPVVTAPAINSVFISSIALNWGSVSCSGYLAEASTDSAFLTVISSSTGNSAATYITVTGLSPNTSYYLRVGSLNQIGERNFLSVPTTSTLANFPIQTLPFTTAELSTGSIKIRWSANSNPGDTLYLVRISSYSNFTNTVFSSSTKNNFASFADLQPNTTFFQEISAYNRLGRITGPVEFSSVATLAYDPSPLGSPPAVYQSSLTFSWANGLNPPPPNTLYLAEISSTNFSDSIISSRTYNLFSTFYGLISDTSYYMRVSALNQSDIPSNYVTLGSSITYSKPPLAFVPALAFYDPKLDGFSVTWDSNGNSSDTIYEIQASTSSSFSPLASSSCANQNYYSFYSLNFNTEYFLRARSVGKKGEYSSWVILGSTFTLSKIQSQVFPENDTLISLPYSYGDIQLRIPPNAIGSATKITAEPEVSFPAPASNAGKLRPTGIGVKLKAYPPTIFDKPVTVTIPYRLSDIPPGYDRRKLIVATYGEDSGLWVPLSSVSDITNNKVSGQTFHFSIFQIMELTPGENLSAVKIYPNPYKPNSSGGRMNFTNLPPGTKIKIFTASGDLIRKLKTGADGMAQWDGNNESGNKAASGVYIVHMTAPDGKTKIMKAAVER
ncbi:MAG: fibronectin type III domain-containing protein [Elusimicrobiota bacterium]